MTEKTVEYCVLGDSQPEGLFLAAGLARKSYSVAVVPSQALGELPSQVPWPLRLPERIGKKRLDDLLFQVGFFRLEDSGLQPKSYQLQVLLPRHRMSFNGQIDRWEKEVNREFPKQARKMVELRKSMASSQRDGRRAALSQLQSFAKEDQEILDWFMMESSEGRPEVASNLKIRQKVFHQWIRRWRTEESKVYRVDQQLSLPFSKFLLEHARKWGVSVSEAPVEFKSRWGYFQITPELRAKKIIVNSLAASRLLAKQHQGAHEKAVSKWLYFDRIECEAQNIPEPLEEVSLIRSHTKHPSILFMERQRLRDEGKLTLGVWLDFNDTSEWQSEIDKARRGLKKLFGFLPESCFKEMKSVFELTEMKGEALRRGELERLSFEADHKDLWSRFFAKIASPVSQKIAGEVSRNIFYCLPYWVDQQDRRGSLENCFRFLQKQDRKAKAQQVSHGR